jgi:hypothetical protein
MTLNKTPIPKLLVSCVSGSVTANDLRIGNIYEYFVLDKLDKRKEWWETTVCDAKDLVYLENNPNDRDFRFIPITADWLLINGYKQMPSGNYLQPNSGNFIWFKKDLKCSIAGEIEVNHIKYVHQLQNLYFSITGLELQLVCLTDR